jgi:hypothetical protein
MRNDFVGLINVYSVQRPSEFLIRSDDGRKNRVKLIETNTGDRRSRNIMKSHGNDISSCEMVSTNVKYPMPIIDPPQMTSKSR